MLNLKKIFCIVIAMVVLLSCSSITAFATVSNSVTFNYDNMSVSTKIYYRDVGDAKDSPIFKYGDLVNRAIEYKLNNPEKDVTIKFAIYKASLDAYVGFNPDDSATYGYVKGNDFGGANSEKLIYSLVKAAKNKVNVDFVFQVDNGGVEDYLNGLMDTACENDSSQTVSDYLRVRRVTWGTSSYQQMHAKFMTVSHYQGDSGNGILNTVYTTTGNIDDHNSAGIPIDKDWVQSGTLISGNPGLYNSFNTYFTMIFNNYNNQSNFQSTVRAAHSAGTLNYSDAHFSSYFTPIPLSPAGVYTPGAGDTSTANSDAWDTTFNPIAKYVDMMASTSGSRYLKFNVYHLKMDNFGQRLYDELYDIYNDSSSGTKHFRLVAKTNSLESTRPLSVFNNIGAITEPAATHCKNYTFAFSGLSEYYSITGSANLKLDAFTSKANALVEIKETTTAHPIYSIFKTIYELQY